MNRDFRIVVLANQKEYEGLLKAAEAAGMPVSTYCRSAALAKAEQDKENRK